ncbi:MAG: 7-carboxy-7-deazaguanine synthase QueE [Desulfurellales bacterium]|nr:MAG: 7-carboxy-7-deazaguanine synthase QueE [Desulfurellales bacterium]
MMFGQNPVRKQDLTTTSLRVQEIFPTIQGEGPFAGTPAVFLRLAGCNLRCHFCDTDFESNYDNLLPPQKVVERVLQAAEHSSIRLLVITGGEPLLQDFVPALKLLFQADPTWKVQIETAGTVWLPSLEVLFLTMPRQISIVCSPKTGEVHRKVQEHCTAWKYIIREVEYQIPLIEREVDDGLPLRSTQIVGKAATLFRPAPITPRQIYLQPCDEGNDNATQHNITCAISLAMRHGYRLCLQIHKLIGLP